MHKFLYRGLFYLILMLISACSTHRTSTQPLSFPADMDAPFFTMKNIMGTEVQVETGILKKIMLMIRGPETFPTLLRPVAVAFSGRDIVYVADADAARVLQYTYRDGDLESVESFGENMLTTPNGIAVWKGMIYVSDAGSGQIHKFDTALKYAGELSVEGLIRPGQLKVNPLNDNLLIVDTPAHQIIILSPQDQVVTKLQKLTHRNLSAPLAVDVAQSGDIIVLDALSRRIEVFTKDYAYLKGFGGYDRVPGTFSNPRGLAISSDGYIFVSDAAFGNIQIFDSKGALLYHFGEHGQAAGQFLLPASMSFDMDDNLYVTDQYNNRVQVFHYFAQKD